MKNIIPKNFRTWIEIDSASAKKNYETFRKIIGPKVKLWSVVKSNAYGHGLVVFSLLADKLGVDGFCVDSLVEGLRLRASPPAGGGMKKPILVLGPTLPEFFGEAARNDITITISNFDALSALESFVAKKATNVDKKATNGEGPARLGVPEFHIKIDTGMHRQGFYTDDIGHVVGVISNSKFLISKLTGIYTHFASAKDINYPTYTDKQFGEFEKAAKIFENAGFSAEGGSASGGGNSITIHCSATGGTLVNKKYHLGAVRVGIGLYGLWPSKELQIQSSEINLRPILSWRAVVSEVKNLRAGDYVGYDLAERVQRGMKIAVIPVGYWHGFPRSLSGIGEVLINGKRAKVLGRVSMDLIVAGPVGAKCKPGDVVTFVGRSGGEEIQAADVAQKSGTIHYEFLTRLNPLMERILL